MGFTWTAHCINIYNDLALLDPSMQGPNTVSMKNVFSLCVFLQFNGQIEGVESFYLSLPGPMAGSAQVLSQVS
jgi:hypothetical protein